MPFEDPHLEEPHRLLMRAIHLVRIYRLAVVCGLPYADRARVLAWEAVGEFARYHHESEMDIAEVVTKTVDQLEEMRVVEAFAAIN